MAASHAACQDEGLPSVLHMTGIYAAVLLTALAVVTVAIHYYAILSAALIVAFGVMLVRRAGARAARIWGANYACTSHSGACAPLRARSACTCPLPPF